jgi:hypothetical protein
MVRRYQRKARPYDYFRRPHLSLNISHQQLHLLHFTFLVVCRWYDGAVHGTSERARIGPAVRGTGGATDVEGRHAHKATGHTVVRVRSDRDGVRRVRNGVDRSHPVLDIALAFPVDERELEVEAVC